VRAWLVVTALLTATVLTSACQGPTFIVQQYAGPPRPIDTIATLRVNGNETVRLMTLDDEDVAAPVASDGRLHIELLPGRHTLTARQGDDVRAPSRPLAFLAEPGHTYRIVFDAERPHVFEVDRGSDRLLRDATEADRPPTAQTPPVDRRPAAPPDAGAPEPPPLDPADAG